MQNSEHSSFVGIYCQTPSSKHQYISAWAAGEKLADDMVAKGADAILRAAKAETKRELIMEHEKKVLQQTAADHDGGLLKTD